MVFSYFGPTDVKIIKVVTAEAEKYFYPFDCKQFPQHFFAVIGIKCKEQEEHSLW